MKRNILVEQGNIPRMSFYAKYDFIREALKRPGYRHSLLPERKCRLEGDSHATGRVYHCGVLLGENGAGSSERNQATYARFCTSVERRRNGHAENCRGNTRIRRGQGDLGYFRRHWAA